MAVFKRGGVYWFHFWHRGVHIQRSTNQGNKQVARDLQAVYRSKLVKGEAGIEEREPAPRLRDFGQVFLDNAAVGRRKAPKETTISFYADALNQILAFEPLADCKLDAITSELVERFVRSKKATLSAARINGMIRTLRRCLQVAMELQLISKVPKLTILQGERERTFVLSPEQERVYLDGCPQPLRDVAILSLETGVRLGEACNLKWDDIHLEPVNGSRFGFIHVRHSKTRYGIRDIPLTERAGRMLAARYEARRSLWVFDNEQGTGPLSKSTLSHQHVVRKRLLKMLKDFVIHSLRHTMLTRLGATGSDAFLIKRIAGHSSVTVSEKYIHPVSRSLEMAFERFEEMGAKSLPEGPKSLGVATESATVKSGQTEISK